MPPQGSFAFLNGCNNNNTTTTTPNNATTKPNLALTTPGQTDMTSTSSVFSISDFLVPGIQPKGWEDWQVADELNPFATGDMQDFSNFDMPFDLTQGLWDVASGLPLEQAYDEFVFDLAPSNFQTPPATVNIADLIVGPDALISPTSVSPLELSFPMNNNYQDLALANLYGFAEQDVQDDEDRFSDSGSDLSEADSDLSSDEDEDEEMEVSNQSKDVEMEMVKEPLELLVESPRAKPTTEDANKRRMEEALVARISNDLGDEHMAGLFRILKGSDDDDNEDDEMEVDLSCLDESTLVQVYQYVETCCMQTVGSILAAEEERERREREQEQLRIREQQAREAEETAYQERQRLYAARTPELSPSYSSGSSSSPSPPYPSSTVPPPPVRSRTGNNKRRPAASSSACTVYREHSDVEQELWMGTQVKSKRKRGDNNSAVCMGGGGTGKGRRIKLNTFVSQPNAFQAVSIGSEEDEEMEEYGEDDEIDVVGI
ncbi:hypothetical protein CPB97_002737 [Podila verticillata]|nr:hypothetical protein CPB97_002737 [Podila verticillata]